jgi:hypothetical protein
MRLKRLIIGGISLILLITILHAKEYRIEISGSYFIQSEKAFRDIYGPGILSGLDIGRRIWKDMELHLEVKYFYSNKGKLTLTEEKTRVKLIPLGVSLRYIFLKKKINLYAGAGLTYTQFVEKNPIGTAKQSKPGFTVKIGGFKRIKGFKKILKVFVIGAHINYHYCKMKPAEIKFDAGGLDLGISVGTEF